MAWSKKTPEEKQQEKFERKQKKIQEKLLKLKEKETLGTSVSPKGGKDATESTFSTILMSFASTLLIILTVGLLFVIKGEITSILNLEGGRVAESSNLYTKNYDFEEVDPFGGNGGATDSSSDSDNTSQSSSGGTPATSSPQNNINRPTGNTNQNTQPTTKAEIIAYFNKAVNRIKTEKPQLYKKETAEATKMDAGAFSGTTADIIKKQFINSQNNSVEIKKNGKHRELVPVYNQDWVSILTENDVESASCVRSGNNYVINLKLIRETNPAADGKSANGRAISIITDEFIYKQVSGLSAGALLSGNISRENIYLDYNESILICKVNIASGNVVEYRTLCKSDATLKDLTITVAGKKTTSTIYATIQSDILFTNFVW